jgi:hydrogenase-4 component F
MGIMALGVGLGGVSAFGALLHALNHSLTKGMLFLVAGNILALYRTKATADVRGVWRVLPVSGALWMLGFLALTGSPPFGPFLSEFTILKGALDQGRGAVAAVYLFFLALVFVGMATAFLPMAQGEPRASTETSRGERLSSIVPPALLGAFVLMLGVYVPEQLQTAIQAAARAVGGP